MPADSYTFPPRKAEIANTITHALGIIMSIGITISLLWNTAVPPVNRLGLFIFAACMFEMYSVSTIYHYSTQLDLKKRLRLFDHISIYFLIAGTYTPFILLCLQGYFRYWLLGIIWGIVALGIIYKLMWWQKYPKLSLWIYLAMGWIIVFFIKSVYAALSTPGFIWLITGGILYSLGTVFYAKRKPIYNHAIWHLFVLAGSFCHFLSILSI